MTLRARECFLLPPGICTRKTWYGWPSARRKNAARRCTTHCRQRKPMKRRTAREILADLLEWLEVPRRAGEQDYKYVARLTEFAQEWERKSDTRSLPEFLEYLDYFEQAGGIVALEDDAPADAVKLMTVHGAKGLEFPRVFVLRVNNKKFPAMERPRVFEFPARLMKEGEPAEQFHIQRAAAFL